jgi:hypothetical protein
VLSNVNNTEMCDAREWEGKQFVFSSVVVFLFANMNINVVLSDPPVRLLQQILKIGVGGLGGLRTAVGTQQARSRPEAPCESDT